MINKTNHLIGATTGATRHGTLLDGMAEAVEIHTKHEANSSLGVEDHTRGPLQTTPMRPCTPRTDAHVLPALLTKPEDSNQGNHVIHIDPIGTVL